MALINFSGKDGEEYRKEFMQNNQLRQLIIEQWAEVCADIHAHHNAYDNFLGQVNKGLEVEKFRRSLTNLKLSKSQNYNEIPYNNTLALAFKLGNYEAVQVFLEDAQYQKQQFISWANILSESILKMRYESSLIEAKKMDIAIHKLWELYRNCSEIADIISKGSSWAKDNIEITPILLLYNRDCQTCKQQAIQQMQ
jgi:hypothetical protein